MAFEIPLHAEDETEYIPDFMNNRELAEDWDGEGEQPFITAKLLPMSSRDLNKATSRGMRGIRHDEEVLIRAEKINKRIFSKYVPSLTSCVLIDRGKRLTASTGKELFELAERGTAMIRDKLIEDIIKALKDGSKAAAGDLKKLRPQSASSEQIPDP